MNEYFEKDGKVWIRFKEPIGIREVLFCTPNIPHGSSEGNYGVAIYIAEALNERENRK